MCIRMEFQFAGLGLWGGGWGSLRGKASGTTEREKMTVDLMCVECCKGSRGSLLFRAPDS